MPDLASISAVLTGLKAASDGLRLIIDAKTQLDGAEVKLRLADALVALSEARAKIADIQDEMRAQEGKINELSEALEMKHDVVKRYDAYYRKDASGAAVGDAFCLRCWEVDHKLIHLVRALKWNRCEKCGSTYDFQLTANLKSGKAPPKGDPCPKCHELAFTLQDSRPDPTFGEMGARVDRYLCSACGYQDEKFRNPGQ